MQLAQSPPVDLDAVFSALADATRRGILARLTEGPATVKELCAPLPISQPAVSKHLRVLERAGLIERSREQTARPAHLRAEPMAAASDWLEHYRAFWNDNFDQLDELLRELNGADQ